jgi:hypothetical protein
LAILEGIFVRHLGSVAVYTVYFVIRSVSVILNIITFAIIAFKVYVLDVPSQDPSRPESEPSPNNNSNPVFVLSMRLIYYCIVQTVTRIGASWYQLQYGFGHTFNDENASAVKKAAYLSEYILTPSAGMGYLMVFLYLQPDAWTVFKSTAIEASNILIPRRKSRRKGKKCRSTAMDSEGSEDQLLPAHSSEDNLPPGAGTGGGAHDETRDSLEHSDYWSGSYHQDNRVRMDSSGVSRESLFPLLDMDEEELAREIDRIHSIKSNQSESVSSSKYPARIYDPKYNI